MRSRLVLADELACALLGLAGFGDLRAPVPIDVVAERLGVGVYLSPIEEDGRLLPISTGFVIQVNDSQPRARQRFTIAHELAHWVTRSAAVRPDLAARTQDAFVSEEVMCNAVAGSLLMPRDWIANEFALASNVRNHTLEVVRRVASAAHVSLAAAVVRLRDVFEWQRTLVHWTWHRGAWIFDGEAGLWPSDEGRVRFEAAIDYSLSQARAAGPAVRTMVLPCVIDGHEYRTPIPVLARAEDAVALISLPRQIAVA